MSIQIREATAADAASLATLARTTFDQTFRGVRDNKDSDIDACIAESFSPAIQLQEIQAHTFFIACRDGKDIGYIMLKLGTSEPCLQGPEPRAELARLYVLAEYKGQGVGKDLYAACLARAQEKGCKSIWLGVWEYNDAAKAFYTGRGFRKRGEHVFQFGEDPQIDEVWEKEI
ncbi:acyl-CoA N-acyltransferase [Powellomyces hirtus]|nr:acyl-CoA N-acyltransferase [Powellomyces hirtus]